MPPGRKLNRKERVAHLAEVSRRYLSGEPQYKIAEALGVYPSTITYDLKRLQEQWLASSLQDFNAARAAQLARVDHLEREYWDAWERSKAQITVTVKESTLTGNRKRVKGSERVEDHVGNPAYLAGVQWCIEARSRLLGLNAPTKVAPTTPDGTREYQEMDDEQVARRIQAILALAETCESPQEEVTDG
jgi:DNA-binding transcriptional ArsR family regulator